MQNKGQIFWRIKQFEGLQPLDGIFGWSIVVLANIPWEEAIRRVCKYTWMIEIPKILRMINVSTGAYIDRLMMWPLS